jgi:hypothetical protein
MDEVRDTLVGSDAGVFAIVGRACDFVFDVLLESRVVHLHMVSYWKANDDVMIPPPSPSP